jgi:exodeoxyribonuclease-3
MKIATWNLNGIRSRYAPLTEWLQRSPPDVLCLQELKATREQVAEVFPMAELPGYWSYWHGAAGGYSGVSLHFRRSTFPESPKYAHPPFDHETRIVEAEAAGRLFACVYIPNGGKDYPAKLAFMRALAAYAGERRAAGARLVLCGDMNIARADQDVYPNQRKDGAIGQRPDEREIFESLVGAGLIDVARSLDPTNDRLYTWWPYWRNLREKNQGWRIDYILASADGPPATACEVLRDVGGSDHAPVVATFTT